MITIAYFCGMYERKIPIQFNCGLDLMKEIVYGKWKLHLIYYIGQGIKRPGELQRKIPDASRRVLNVQLNQLEEHEIVAKTVYPQMPPKVEYHLTELGKSLQPLLSALGQWGDDNKEQLRHVLTKTIIETKTNERP